MPVNVAMSETRISSCTGSALAIALRSWNYGNIVNQETIAVVGRGYAGLPPAAGFGKKFKTIGHDLYESKIANYRKGSVAHHCLVTRGLEPVQRV